MLWGTSEVAEFLGISYEAALSIMKSGKLVTCQTQDMVPDSKSTQLLTTKYNVICYVALRLNLPVSLMADFYRESSPSFTEATIDANRTNAGSTTADH